MICIGLGNRKSFCIDNSMQMLVKSDVPGEEDNSFSLGEATVENLDTLVHCIKQLRHQCRQAGEGDPNG